MAGIVITTQPISASVNKNRTTTLNVSATATVGTLKYDWYEDSSPDILLQTGSQSSFIPLPLTTTKNYYVNISTSDQPTVFVKSNVVTITVIDPPVLLNAPQNTRIGLGNSTTLSVLLEESPNGSVYSYQWYIGASGLTNNPIAGANSSSYTFQNAQFSTSFWVQISSDAGFINSPTARVTVVESLSDNSNLSQKTEILGEKFNGAGSTNILGGFSLTDLRVVSQAQSLADCAKNIPNRLKDKGIEIATKQLDNLLKDSTGVGLEDLAALKAKYDKVNEIVDYVKNFDPKTLTLADGLLALKKATGVDLEAKASKLLDDFQNVGGVSDLLTNLNNLDICKIPNYNANGIPIPPESNIPVGVSPSPVEAFEPIGLNEYSSEAKDEYDAFMFQLKEHIEPETSGLGSESYKSSLSYLNVITMAYHDKLKVTTDDSKDAQYKAEFEQSINDTLQNNSSWDKDVTGSFKNRAAVIANVINRNAQIIRNFYNQTGTGDWLPWYMSAYGLVKADDGSSLDKTTENDIAKGAIKEEWQYLGTRNNKLVKGTSVASNYWKFGTVLEIRYADTKEPVGSGRVRVDDAGGMSKNVIDYFCGGDRALFKQITSKSKNQGSKTKPRYTTPIEIRLVSGGPK
jgi:hypothetical protein